MWARCHFAQSSSKLGVSSVAVDAAKPGLLFSFQSCLKLDSLPFCSGKGSHWGNLLSGGQCSPGFFNFTPRSRSSWICPFCCPTFDPRFDNALASYDVPRFQFFFAWFGLTWPTVLFLGWTPGRYLHAFTISCMV